MHVRAAGVLLCGAAMMTPPHRADRPPTLHAGRFVIAPGVARDTEPDTLSDERLAAFNARRATNRFGHYFTGEQIREHHGARLSDLLRAVPGVTLAPSSRVGNLVRIRGCQPLVWMDGVRLPGTELDEAASPADVAGLEVYSATTGVPARYFDRSNPCGTLLVWTRSD